MGQTGVFDKDEIKSIKVMAWMLLPVQESLQKTE